MRRSRVLRSWRIEAAEDGSPSREHILTQIDGVAKDVPELVKPRGAGSSGSRQPVLKTEKPLSRDALENMGPDEINSRWDTVRKFLAGKRSYPNPSQSLTVPVCCGQSYMDGCGGHERGI